MQSHLTKFIAVLCGVFIFMLALAPMPSQIASARPLLNITETPVEPTSPVNPTSPPVEPTNPPVVEPTNPPVVEPTNPPTDAVDVPDRDNSRPNIEIKKTIDQSEGVPGELVAFSLHITNRGDKRAENVVVTDDLPSYLLLHDYSTSKGTINADGNTVRAELGTVEVGEYVVVRIRAYVAADAPETGRNTGSVTNSNGDKDPNNNSSTISFPIRQVVVLSPTPSLEIEIPVADEVVPDESIEAPVAPTTAPVAPVAPAPRPPRDLPATGESDQSNALNIWASILSLIAMLGLGFGFYLRQRSIKGQRS